MADDDGHDAGAEEGDEAWPGRAVPGDHHVDQGLVRAEQGAGIHDVRMDGAFPQGGARALREAQRHPVDRAEQGRDRRADRVGDGA